MRIAAILAGNESNERPKASFQNGEKRVHVFRYTIKNS